MATKKTEPLSIGDLMQAQRSLLKDRSLTEGQRRMAEQQLAKLQDLQNSFEKSNEKLDTDLKAITKLKGTSQQVSLGDVRTEMRGIRADLKSLAVANGRSVPTPPPSYSAPSSPQASPQTRNNDSASRSDEKARTELLNKIKNVVEAKTDLKMGGAKNETLANKNNEAFSNFIKESSKRSEILSDATEDQVKIFQKIEDTLMKLQSAGSEDSKKLRDELAKIKGELGESGDTKAKSKIGGLLANARGSATIGDRGNKGTLGDAWAAATGKKTVLKEGYGYDARGEGSKVRDEKTGRFASIKNAGMGKFAGAASILGNFVGEKTENFVESKRSEKFQNFADNFRTSENNHGARISELQGQQDALMNGGGAAPTPKGRPNLSLIQGGKSASALGGATDGLKAQTINITAATVNLSGGDKKGAGAVKEAPKTPAPPAKPAETPPKQPAPKAEPVAKPPELPPTPPQQIPAAPGTTAVPTPAPPPANPAPESTGGLADMASEGLMSKAGGMLKGAKGGLIKGGIAALGGMALSAGGDMLKESGHEKLGGAMDVAGEAASWGGTGAMIGSVVPGVGTAIGGAVGAVAGAGYGLYKNWGNFFGGDKKGSGGKEGFGKLQGDDPDAPNYDADLASIKADLAVPGTEARATGGPVVEGKSYLVGEKGPEVMTPSTDGKITPNGAGLNYGMKMSDIKGAAQDTYEDQNGASISTHEDGVKVKRNKDGTVEVMGAGGSTTFDANGKEIKSSSPTIGGYGEERDAQGNKTKNYNSGGLDVSETTDAQGKFVKSKSSYDFGTVSYTHLRAHETG
jgi:hypothetical protein